MKYSIIIGTYNHLEDLLKPCIESIIKYTDLSDVEIIVVSNGCTDDTDSYIKSLGHPFKLITHPEPLGYAKAYNLGIDAATGHYIILLNNDIVLQPQEKNKWLQMLEQPFIEDPKVGISGPLLGFSEPAGQDFLIFFCVMISRELINKLKLSEDYGVGGGEDTEFCIEAKKLGYQLAVSAPGNTYPDHNEKIIIGNFPIYHKGEGTVNDNPEWQKIFDENSCKLAKKYNNNWYKNRLLNNYERAVVDASEDMNSLPREKARYEFAAKNLQGKKILEIGCSSGYGLRFFPSDIEYTGIDYDSAIIEFAKENFSGPNRKFIHADINTVELTEYYDTIIAFEVIEHLDNGKEIAQKLKKHCDTLLITTPYKEVPGLWGIHHKLHRLSEKDFPAFEYHFINEEGHLLDKPDQFNGLNLMIMKWEKNKQYNIKPSILAFVPTKNRYDSLALTIQSIALQTYKPDALLIFDDGEHRDIRPDPVYSHLFKLLDNQGISWEVIFGDGKGQHFGHEYANNKGFDLVWRIDDDEVASPDVLKLLVKAMSDPDVGAVGGAVITLGEEQKGGTSKIADILHTPNIQWSSKNPKSEVDHLYSSFLYRAGIAHYNLRLSPVAHREETLFTLALKEKGYKLLFIPEAITYHFRQPKGGIRDNNHLFFFEHDERIFTSYLESIGIKIISLDNGLGDHLVFLNLIEELLQKYSLLIIGCCYPEVFEEYKNSNKIKLVPVGVTNPVTDDNIYKFMAENQWKTSVLSAYKAMLRLS